MNGRLDQVTDHRLDVLAHVAHLSELRGLDLDKWGSCQPSQPAGNFSLSDPGGTDQDDVLGRDLIAKVRRHLLAAPTIAERHGDRPLGFRLTNDEVVELGNHLARGELGTGNRLLFVNLHFISPGKIPRGPG